MNVALTIVAVMFIAAAASILIGVHMLLGLAWVFIALGLMLFGAAIILRAGIAHG